MAKLTQAVQIMLVSQVASDYRTPTSDVEVHIGTGLADGIDTGIRAKTVQDAMKMIADKIGGKA